MMFPRSSELPWFGFGALVVAAVGVHLLSGFIDWLARPTAGVPAATSIAAAPIAPSQVTMPTARAPAVSPTVVAPSRVEPAPVAPSPMVTAASGWLPQSVSAARLQGWLAFQQRGGVMPSELKQRLEFALRAAERVMQGRSLAQSEESYLERRGAQVIRLNNEVTVRFTPDALPIPPSTR